jgi:hypothetical protein
VDSKLLFETKASPLSKLPWNWKTQPRMRNSLFNHLADTLENLPARAILKTLELESKMLKDDLLNDRPVPVGEAQSVVDFYDFIRSVKEGLPTKKLISANHNHHQAFFRKTIERLIAAKELPFAALRQFEESIVR